MDHSKLTSILIIFTISNQLCISEEICSVIEKRDKDFKPCIFPFTYEGVTYNNCTDVNDPDGKLWCSTKLDEDGNHVESGGFWGHCGQDCKINLFQEKAEFSISSFLPDFSKCGENTDPSRIIDSSSVGIWPWMASLGFWSDREWNHLCGATLISQTRIITAAHCIAPEKDAIQRLKVRLGDDNHSSVNDDQYVQDTNIEQIFIHPKYVESKAYYDIAVLNISQVQFTKRVRPICLPPSPLIFEQDKYEGRLSTLIGWGNNFLSGKASTTLKKTTLEIYDYSYCNSTHERTSGSVAGLVERYLPQLFQPNLLCAGYESSQHGSCQGDSGGPLMVFNTKTSQYFQLGMVSGGVSTCGDKEIPGYYTRLDFPEVADFIQDPENFAMNREVIEYPENSIFLKYMGDIENGEPSGKGTMIYKNGNKYEGEWKNGKQDGTGILTFNNEIGNYSGHWKDGNKSGYGTLTLKSGSVYAGEFENDLRNGFGKYTYSSGSTYEGQWRDDVRSGNGTYTSISGEKYVGEFGNDLKNGFGNITFSDNNTYEGEWKNDEESGNGTFIWKSGTWAGDEYIGEFENSLRNGFGKYTFANSEIYEGQWKDNQRSGNGTFTSISGEVYVGEFENSMKNGFGKITFSDNSTYEGQWKDDQKSGNGTYTWIKGDKYVGEWENGSQAGYGTYFFADGRTYEGQLKNDSFSGHGTYTWLDGSTYVGEFENNNFNGLGKRTFSNGDTYEGQFKDDEFSGNGTITWINGQIYVGEFDNGNFNGFGKKTYTNGDTYEGQWKDDIQSGNGTFIWKDGDKYVGEFENDMKNGFGIFTYDDGRTYEGQWEDDKKSGKGTFTKINGEKYVGEFKNDLKHGSGVEYSAHGEIINQGQWEEGKFISE